METYNYNDYKEAGIDQVLYRTTSPHPKKAFCGGFISRSIIPQDKLVRAIRGEVFDVAVDLRPGSKTYGQWYGVLPKRTKSSSLSPRISHTAL